MRVAGAAIGASAAGVVAVTWRVRHWWRKTSQEFDEIMERRLHADDMWDDE